MSAIVESVKTVADLKKKPILNPTTTIGVQVLGYYEPGDGGGGLFIWNPESKDKNDDAITLQSVTRAVDEKGRWKRQFDEPISVRWFGAKGDGVTDDLAALNLAAAAAKTLNADIEISSGTYLVSGPWILSGATRKVIGTGEVTIQRANPQVLAKLTENAMKGSSTLRVTPGAKFEGGQAIQIATIDADNHLFIERFTGPLIVASADGDEVKLTSPLVLTPKLDSLPAECVITSGLTDEVIQFDASVINASLDKIKVEGIGSLVLGVRRFGIGYKGNGALRCINVESTHHSQAGVCIYSGKGQFSFIDCNMHHNGYAGIYGSPIGGSVEVIGGNYSDNGPTWSRSSAYGISLNGSKTVVIGAKCENNSANQIDVHSTHNKSVLIVQGCTLAWGANNGEKMPGTMVSIAGECETLIVEGCDMDGHRALAKQTGGIIAGGFQATRKGIGASEVGENQETIRVVNNVFRNMICGASVLLSPWDVKDVELVGNTFINCSDSIIVDNQEHPGHFDPFTGEPDLTGLDKRQIPDIVRIGLNTLVDSGGCYVTCGGLIIYEENLFIRKYSEPYTVAPFRVDDTNIGRVGRVIRRNNKAIGLTSGVFTQTPTTAALPSHYHWSVGDQESNEAPTPGIYQGYVCTVAGTAETTTSTGTKATTHEGTTTIDVDDCTLFCPQQWITVNDGEANLVQFFKGEKAVRQSFVRILRVIGLGAKDGKGKPGQLIVELPAGKGVEKQNINFQKAVFQTINASELRYGNTLRTKVDETGIGVFGVKPVERAAAYKQTYSTTARTVENDTAADLVTTPATQEAPFGFSSAAQANDIAIEFNKLRADLLALKKVVNSIIDDQQAYGWFQ